MARGFKAVMVKQQGGATVYYPRADPSMVFIPGTTHVHEGPVELCKAGFHGCWDLRDCLVHYDLDDPAVRVFAADFNGEMEFGDGRFVAKRVKLDPLPLSASVIREMMDGALVAAGFTPWNWKYCGVTNEYIRHDGAFAFSFKGTCLSELKVRAGLPGARFPLLTKYGFMPRVGITFSRAGRILYVFSYNNCGGISHWLNVDASLRAEAEAVLHFAQTKM